MSSNGFVIRATWANSYDAARKATDLAHRASFRAAELWESAPEGTLKESLGEAFDATCAAHGEAASFASTALHATVPAAAASAAAGAWLALAKAEDALAVALKRAEGETPKQTPLSSIL